MGTQLQFSLVTHFCQGKRVDTVLSFIEKGEFCSSKMMQQSTCDKTQNRSLHPSECCKNQISKPQTDNHNTTISHIEISNIGAVLTVLLWSVWNLSQEDTRTAFQVLSPPPLLNQSRQILFQSFLH
ncbi:hypothetical protein K4L44_07275 [Halosquirtibacter laminarini]|uniref:Uncharacterized protein n=1 Tax=Halosquirtibacter laminarini TaxID=3374600 RepID=A0AC61NIR9_9BACT|nr:hypothetical protein K4L44_07275 [Prolixibacteraceae bacterium]